MVQGLPPVAVDRLWRHRPDVVLDALILFQSDMTRCHITNTIPITTIS
jgi:hypothetical protein